MFTYITTCRDVINGEITPVYISDDKLVPFNTRKDAFDAAYESAKNELETLNDGATEGVSFGIPSDNEFESMEKIVVNYYYDDNTEMVTTRTIVDIG